MATLHNNDTQQQNLVVIPTRILPVHCYLVLFMCIFVFIVFTPKNNSIYCYLFDPIHSFRSSHRWICHFPRDSSNCSQLECERWAIESFSSPSSNVGPSHSVRRVPMLGPETGETDSRLATDSGQVRGCDVKSRKLKRGKIGILPVISNWTLTRASQAIVISKSLYQPSIFSFGKGAQPRK